MYKGLRSIMKAGTQAGSKENRVPDMAVPRIGVGGLTIERLEES